MSCGAPHVLLLIDDLPTLATFERPLRHVAPTRILSSLASAEKALESGARCAGIVVGAHVSDRDAVTVLTVLRRRDLDAPALIIAPHPNVEAMNRAFTSNTGYVCSPISSDVAQAFARRVLLHVQLDAPAVEALAETVAAAKGLTLREAHVLALALQGRDRRNELSEALGIGENTVRKHVRTLLGKFRAENLRSLVLSVLRQHHRADGVVVEVVPPRASDVVHTADGWAS